MPAPKCSTELKFIELYETLGPRETARKLGLPKQNVTIRASRLRKLGLKLEGPRGPARNGTTIPAPAGSSRLELEVRNGMVIVASDAHYWPGETSLMHRALVLLCRELKPQALILNGDVMDLPRASRHAAIGWEKRPEIHEEIEWAQACTHELALAAGRGCQKIWTLGNHDCLDSETECLTRDGWKKYFQLQQDDYILSRRMNGSIYWSRLDEIVTFPYDGQLVTVDKTRMSMAITPNHRVLLSRLNWKTAHYDITEYRQADNLPSSFDIPVTGQIVNNEYKLPDAAIALAGWILTDGSIQGVDISIFQSKLQGCTKIRDLLESSGLEYSEYRRQRPMKDIRGRPAVQAPLLSHQFRLTQESSREVLKWFPGKGQLPWWASELSGRQFQVLLDALIAGDGVWDGTTPSNKTCAVLYGTEHFLSSVQAVAVLHGWRARLTKDNRGDWRLCLARESKLRIEKKEVCKRHYTGTVWCLRVPEGNFMVRRNGCAYFTGNSRFETRIANLAPEYAKIKGVHLRDHFPTWQPCWSTFINSNVLVKHRFRGGIHAVHNNLLWSGVNIVTWHLHSAQVRALTLYDERTIWGMDTGCLAEPSARTFTDYTEDNPKNWRSGFGVLTFLDGRLMMPELVLKWDEKNVQFRGKLIRA